MTGQRIGYKRVSTVDQNTARQLDGVAVGKMFEDKASGKNTARPQLQAALLVLSLSIAVSRVILGMHFVSDVVVGSLLGAGLGYGAYLLIR